MSHHLSVLTHRGVYSIAVVPRRSPGSILSLLSPAISRAVPRRGDVYMGRCDGRYNTDHRGNTPFSTRCACSRGFSLIARYDRRSCGVAGFCRERPRWRIDARSKFKRSKPCREISRRKCTRREKRDDKLTPWNYFDGTRDPQCAGIKSRIKSTNRSDNASLVFVTGTIRCGFPGYRCDIHVLFRREYTIIDSEPSRPVGISSLDAEFIIEMDSCCSHGEIYVYMYMYPHGCAQMRKLGSTGGNGDCQVLYTYVFLLAFSDCRFRKFFANYCIA